MNHATACRPQIDTTPAKPVHGSPADEGGCGVRRSWAFRLQIWTVSRCMALWQRQ